MTCDEVQARLSAHLDGEAGDREEAVRAHVVSCDGCRKMLDGFRHVSAQIRNVEEAPAALVAGIRRRVREGSRRAALIPKIAAAAVLVASLLWAIVLLGGGDGTMRMAGGLPESEERILYGAPPGVDEWMAIILSGGGPR